ncbi:MAG TPA: hypothetical protein VJT73_00625 [Polyangiaceae bacterium]|nr:hypothetical protein [Polyangiaceae bacterium]
MLALPLLIFGSNYFFHIFPLPTGDANEGQRLLQAMRDGGLMTAVAFSHVVAGVMLVVPRTRFAGALLQLPMSLGITAFHVTMLPSGLVMAVPMLLLNLGALVDRVRLEGLIKGE